MGQRPGKVRTRRRDAGAPRVVKPVLRILSDLAFNVQAQPPRMNRKPLHQQLYFWVLIGMLLGVLVGYFTPAEKPLKAHVFGSDITFSGTALKPLSDAFIRLIRMMIAPIIFTTVVTGIAGMGSLKRLGRIGLRAFLYFEVMTTLALMIGWIVAAVFHPGAGMNVDIATLNTADLKDTLSKAREHHSIVEFL